MASILMTLPCIYTCIYNRGIWNMKNLEKRAVYFFDRLALLISEDPEVLDVLHYYRRFTDMFRILQYYGYLTDMTLDEYIDNAIQAG